MTKSQIQEAAEREYPVRMECDVYGHEWDDNLHERLAYIKGIHAALNSDTVKGMAEALKYVDKELEKNYGFSEYGAVRSKIGLALHQYEQSIK